MAYHSVVQKIIDLLQSRNYWFEVFEHEAVVTSEQAALTRPGYTLNQGTKAMIVKAYKSKTESFFAMLVFPADQKFNSKKVQTALGVKSIRFATEVEVGELTQGVLPGGVPPFGNLFNLPVFADPAVFQNTKIVFNAGDRAFSVAINSQDYKDLINPTVVNLI